MRLPLTLTFILTSCALANAETYKIGYVFDQAHTETQKKFIESVTRYNKEGNATKLQAVGYGGDNKNAESLLKRLVTNDDVDALVCIGNDSIDASVAKISKANSVASLLCSSRNGSFDEFKTEVANLKETIGRVANSKKQKELEERLLSEKEREQFQKKAALFRKNIAVGDDTSYGLVIEVKRPLVKIQTTQYVVQKYTKWITKYNQYGSYHDPEESSNVNEALVEKWFKIDEVFPK